MAPLALLVALHKKNVFTPFVIFLFDSTLQKFAYYLNSVSLFTPAVVILITLLFRFLSKRAQ